MVLYNDTMYDINKQIKATDIAVMFVLSLDKLFDVLGKTVTVPAEDLQCWCNNIYRNYGYNDKIHSV